MTMKRLSLLLVAMLVCCVAFGGELKYATSYNLPYKESKDAYVSERCRLDVYYPEDTTGCPVVVWFHGGGLTSGSKSFPWKLKENKMVLVAVNYRLLPKVNIDECLDDAAAAVAWVFREAGKYGAIRRRYSFPAIPPEVI